MSIEYRPGHIYGRTLTMANAAEELRDLAHRATECCIDARTGDPQDPAAYRKLGVAAAELAQALRDTAIEHEGVARWQNFLERDERRHGD